MYTGSGQFNYSIKGTHNSLTEGRHELKMLPLSKRTLVAAIASFSFLLALVVFQLQQQENQRFGDGYHYVTSSAIQWFKLNGEHHPPNHPKEPPLPNLYAVFCSNTPNGESYRSNDYAFILPLTALAWERIGFRSIVIIVGYRCEWDNDPALSLILSFLEARKAIVIFIPSPIENRAMLSQTARIFAHNLPGFPAKDNDYVITSDADLWPIHREHYTPRPSRKLVLVHSGCCGTFQWNGTSYRMYPMSNIGATVSAWKDIINYNHMVII